MKKIIWISPGDPSQRTGGYIYNSKICTGLFENGYLSEMLILDGQWPQSFSKVRWDEQLNTISDNEFVVVDGMAWIAFSERQQKDLASRCHVWVLIHHLFDLDPAFKDKEDVNTDLTSLNWVSGWISTSVLTKDIINQRLNQNGGVVVQPGIEKSVYIKNKNYLNLLNIANLTPIKHQDLLLKKLAVLHQYDWTLRIVGSLDRDNEWVEYLIRLTADLGLDKRVSFVGECNQSELETHFDWAGVMVHTPIFESYGMVLSEALSRGIPVISTPAGATHHLNSKAIINVADNTLEATLSNWFDNRSFRNAAYKDALSLRFPSWSEQVYQFQLQTGLMKHSFSSSWLKQREPFDHAARSEEFVKLFLDYVNSSSMRLLDLATGLASGPRFMNNHHAKQISWLLLDHDKALLDRVYAEQIGTYFDHSIQLFNMDVHNIDALPISVDGVTTQALLDLVSEHWLGQFSSWLSTHKLPLLAALTVDGRFKWSIVDPLDELVQSAFKIHQTWDRGFGPSVGIDAVHVLKRLLKEKGYQVQTKKTDWVILKKDEQMLKEMIRGIAFAAKEAIRDVDGLPSDVECWLKRRQNQIGSLELEVGHLDLLALPG
ncbi:MAG: hypothetical protein CMP39_01150 [Rickettsiales bacterium]|nr:hypothetical protein [Rickettsiales bacterium]